MKKKGFTLIELLAVIVILAIIALIATPIVMNVIENSRKGAAERSTENYIDAVETAIMEARLDGPILADGTYTLAELEAAIGTIEVSGNKPTEGSVTIQGGIVVTDPTTKIKVGNYEVSYDANGKITATKSVDGSNTSIVLYRSSTDLISIGATIEDPSIFPTDPTTLGNVYLKHVLDEDNKVAESYVCAIFNDEICITAGSESVYAQNKLILEGLQDEGVTCTISEFQAGCETESGADYVYMNAYSYGDVDAGNNNTYCNGYGNNSSSSCGSY